MNWDDIWKIIFGFLVSTGVIGGVILAVIKSSMNLIAKRLEEKYTLKLNKELEKYKSGLDNKIYISKTKFDAEFSIYRELSKAFFEMVKGINAMIPAGYATYPADKEVRKKYETECYKKASETVVLAQDTLNSNAPFISNDLFEKYDEILILCKIQLRVFEDRWNVFFFVPQEEKGSLSTEDYLRTEKIHEKFKTINTNIREYLSKIDVLD